MSLLKILYMAGDNLSLSIIRKTQHKRVVVEVAAEGLSSDVWAWRKYGQKPIKGSPHPRSLSLSLSVEKH